MEEGSLRCDANVSVRPAGAEALRRQGGDEEPELVPARAARASSTKSSGRSAARLGGGRVEQETRLWDASAGRTVSMRSKEEAHDYRYFPEPDLPPLTLERPGSRRSAATLPELPDARRRRFVEQYALPDYDASAADAPRASSPTTSKPPRPPSGNAKAASNWIMGELSAKLNELGMAITDVPLTPERLAGLIRLIDAGTISGPVTRDVFEKMFTSESGAAEIVEREGLARIDDQDAIVAAVREVLAANPQPVAQYRAGKQQTFGFLVGKVMKETRGKANPALVNDAVAPPAERRRKLNDRGPPGVEAVRPRSLCPPRAVAAGRQG